MIIQYASDLHLEFPENKKFLSANPLKSMGDVLVLAGDIVPFAVMDEQNDFFDYISDHFQRTYWIPGNHEYYYFDLGTKCGTLNENIRSNIHLVNNLMINLNNVRFVFSTLWSKISEMNQWQTENSVSDFQVIKYQGQRFTASQFNRLHEESLNFINSELQQTTSDKTVVVTHHVPTMMNYPEQYKKDALNEAFAAELFDLIEAYQPDYWVYGHHHANTPAFEIGKTQMLTNQLGYVKYHEHKSFNTEMAITL